ncbi:pyridoxal-phosphate dependent enzyme [Cupriavidus basilensis]
MRNGAACSSPAARWWKAPPAILGIGLAHICAARGYSLHRGDPGHPVPGKMDRLRLLGAEVRPVPAAPYADPNNYQKVAGRLAQETENAIWANQFDNLANRQAHYETTGPEIWHDTAGKVDAFVCSTGTGGTLAGVARFLKEKERNPPVRIVLADPYGSGLYHFVKHREVKAEGNSITEGIGSSRVTANLADTPIDDAVRIDDRSCVDTVSTGCCARKAYGWAVRPASTWRRRRAGPRDGARPHHRYAAVRPRRPVCRAPVQCGLAGGQGADAAARRGTALSTALA